MKQKPYVTRKQLADGIDLALQDHLAHPDIPVTWDCGKYRTQYSCWAYGEALTRLVSRPPNLWIGDVAANAVIDQLCPGLSLRTSAFTTLDYGELDLNPRHRRALRKAQEARATWLLFVKEAILDGTLDIQKVNDEINSYIDSNRGF